ncbi:hypothetical protein [Paenibacillus sp.]|nr:hypothetical protein [Paenibacillus sp.]
MKFKAQEKQNQLIEKVTPQHLVVGIDPLDRRNEGMRGHRPVEIWE